MPRLSTRPLIGAIPSLLVALLVTPPAAAGQTDEASAQVRAVVEGFKAALRAGDGEGALAQLHPNVRIFEGGHAESREEYARGHLGSDMRFLQAVESTTTWDQVLVDAQTALYMSEYTVKGEYRGREIDAHGTETIVVARTEGGWKILHIHWSSR